LSLYGALPLITTPTKFVGMNGTPPIIMVVQISLGSGIGACKPMYLSSFSIQNIYGLIGFHSTPPTTCFPQGYLRKTTFHPLSFGSLEKLVMYELGKQTIGHKWE
jgi:hypothetical protein